MNVRADRLALGFSLVGPGRVGSSLARWLCAHGARLGCVGGRSEVAAEDLAKELGGRTMALDALESSGDDLLLIAVSDPAVADVARILASRSQAAVILHVSGAIAVEALAPLRARGSAVGAMHPLRAFPSPSHDVADAAGVLFSLGGDLAAVEMSAAIVDAWTGRSLRIRDDQRPLYHLAASLAAGGVVTLLATATELAERAGLPASVIDGYHSLAHQALSESERHPHPATAITGPVARGDAQAVESLLQALADQAPAALDIVVAIARETLRQRAALSGTARDHSKIPSPVAKVLQRKSFLDRD
jgi:predicted short-subunit dehydrogenase-like oxidoreductase (DUF2520 family)